MWQPSEQFGPSPDLLPAGPLQIAVSTKRAAKMLDISVKLLRTKPIPSFKVGRSRCYLVDDLKKWAVEERDRQQWVPLRRSRGRRQLAATTTASA